MENFHCSSFYSNNSNQMKPNTSLEKALVTRGRLAISCQVVRLPAAIVDKKATQTSDIRLALWAVASW